MCTGFYGTSETQTFNEGSRVGSDYLAEVCREWEAEARKAQVQRVAVLRTGTPPPSLTLAYLLTAPSVIVRPDCHAR